jgi:hypothetical protein
MVIGRALSDIFRVTEIDFFEVILEVLCSEKLNSFSYLAALIIKASIEGLIAAISAASFGFILRFTQLSTLIIPVGRRSIFREATNKRCNGVTIVVNLQVIALKEKMLIHKEKNLNFSFNIFLQALTQFLPFGY